jgi:hypothetical protein
MAELQGVNPATNNPSSAAREAVKRFTQGADSIKSAARADVMSVDFTQFLALGNVNLFDIYLESSALASAQSEITTGDIFDVFTQAQFEYSDHVVDLSNRIYGDNYELTDADLFTGAYRQVRQQIQVRSELVTPVDADGTPGQPYYLVARRNAMPMARPYNWEAFSSAVGTQMTLKLWPTDEEGVYKLGVDANHVEYISLGDTSVWDREYKAVLSSDVAKLFTRVLNAMPRDIKESIISSFTSRQLARQALFATVFSKIASQLVLVDATADTEANAEVEVEVATSESVDA